MLQTKNDILLKHLQQGFVRSNLGHVQKNLEKLMIYAPPKEYPSLLDIGVGEGPGELHLLKKAGYRVRGITIQVWMTRPNIFLMDACDQRFPSEYFDVVYSRQVFEHIYNPRLAIMETWISLRLGGIFFLIVPLPDEYLVISHPSMFTDEQWIRILRETGFTLKHKEVTKHSNIIITEKAQPTDKRMINALAELTELRMSGNTL